ncbi:MAG: hypothetical protein CL678_10945 [Bdellovibrionaceae bacterium]|nr:hypothetical protein [Pseudobdellovibrionaceae bacterium]|tara:strand:+ start:2279 stop:3409 length:1131 start_codon:yes stop_codon:yes gene_type:complete
MRVISSLFGAILLISCQEPTQWVDYYHEFSEDGACDFLVTQAGQAVYSSDSHQKSLFERHPMGSDCLDLLKAYIQPRLSPQVISQGEAFKNKIYEVFYIFYAYPLRFENSLGEEKIFQKADFPKNSYTCVFHANDPALEPCSFSEKPGLPDRNEAKTDFYLMNDPQKNINKSLFNYVMNRIVEIDFVENIDAIAKFKIKKGRLSLTSSWWNSEQEVNSPFYRAGIFLHEARHSEFDHTYCDQKNKKDKNCDNNLDGAYGLQIQYFSALIHEAGRFADYKFDPPLSMVDFLTLGNQMCVYARDRVINDEDIYLSFEEKELNCDHFAILDLLLFEGIKWWEIEKGPLLGPEDSFSLIRKISSNFNLKMDCGDNDEDFN